MEIRTNEHPPRLKTDIEDFLLERKIRRLSPRTVDGHRLNLARFADFCGDYGVTATTQIDAPLLRRFVAKLGAAHNPGGVAHIYRSVKAFLNWYELEYDDRNWRNPARRVQVANGAPDALEPLDLKEFAALLAACERKTLAGERDRAILLTLLDTGLRKSELVALTTDDLNRQTGAIQVRAGKGGKSRVVYVGATTRRVLNTYLRYRAALVEHTQRTHGLTPTTALWISSRTAKPIGAAGVRDILIRRAADAGIPDPPLHAFRRAFALNSLRNGMDVLTLQRLLGHADLSVINRYVKLLHEDLRAGAEQFGVVDNL